MVFYGIGAGDKHVMPAAFQKVLGERCLAWRDAMSPGAAIYEVHLRVPAADAASAIRSARMLVKHPLIKVARDAKFADIPTKMEEPVRVNC